MKVKRFYYVVPACTSGTLHRVYSRLKVEGELTACGRSVTPHWRWYLKPKKLYPRCKVCEKAS